MFTPLFCRFEDMLWNVSWPDKRGSRASSFQKQGSWGTSEGWFWMLHAPQLLLILILVSPFEWSTFVNDFLISNSTSLSSYQCYCSILHHESPPWLPYHTFSQLLFFMLSIMTIEAGIPEYLDFISFLFFLYTLTIITNVSDLSDSNILSLKY